MTDLAVIFGKDLTKLKEEILKYSSEDALYAKAEGISNSGGNLCMHLCGNLRHFIGFHLGNSGYVRNRPEEFEGRFSKERLLADIQETQEIVVKTLNNLSEVDLSGSFPELTSYGAMTTQQFLLHLLSHLNYHIGQINYHRRLITSN
jgi:uncharacterized damage-inducible protein DinB